MQFDLAAYANSVFVETGTFHGDGVRRALKAGYGKVITLEVFEPLIAENQERFQKKIADGIVQIVHGDSGEVLERALKGIGNVPITFWLDANIQTQNGGGVGSEKCPVVAELKQIAKARAPYFEDVVLIDDLRLIEHRKAKWAIDLGEMYRIIWEINPGVSLSRLDGHVPCDVLCCTPARRENGQ